MAFNFDLPRSGYWLMFVLHVQSSVEMHTKVLYCSILLDKIVFCNNWWAGSFPSPESYLSCFLSFLSIFYFLLILKFCVLGLKQLGCVHVTISSAKVVVRISGHV